jgi:pimeloyl-ACP methyl ester carboxylesterase
VAFYERMLIECRADARAAVGLALSDMDLWHALAHLTIPTLVVSGDRDRLTPPAHARRIAQELPQPAGLIELRDTGHMSPLERPRELGDALLRLARAPAAAVDLTGDRV